MKAAVIYPDDPRPRYTDFAQPQVQNDNELLVSVKAVAIKHLDKSIASGRHYTSDAPKVQGQIIGGDGVALLEDGTRVYGMGVSGMLAEKAVIYKDRIVQLPQGLDDATAAALPNAVIGAAMGLKFKADIQPGSVVLINGATGVTGRIAVQLAKYYGAQKVIATGRNPESLAGLFSLGADETISVAEDSKDFSAQLATIHQNTPIDAVIDYLWGPTAESILTVLKGKGMYTRSVSYVSVGSMSGDQIRLSSAILRSANLTLTGSGMGSWSKQQVSQAFTEILPEAFRLATEGKLKIETKTENFSKIAGIWDFEIPAGQRLVLTV